MVRLRWVVGCAVILGLGVLLPLAVVGADLSREDVVAVIRERVLPSLALPQEYVAYLYPEILSPDDRLAPYAPEPMPDEVEAIPHLIPYGIDRPVWFCWIDLAPSSRYAHPTVFVLIDAADGTVSVFREAWWPVLNGQSLWAQPEEAWNSIDRIASPAEMEKCAPSKAAVLDCHADRPGADYYDWALVVNGWSPGEPDRDAFDVDAAGICNALGDLGMRVSILGPGEASPESLEAFVVRLFTEIPLYKCCDRLYFYFIAHATPGSLWIGGQRLRADELARVLFLPGDVYVPSRVYVFLETGYGGSFLPALASTGNIIRVWSASGADEPASRDQDGVVDPNPDDVGGEWTSSFLATLERLLQENDLAIRAAEFGREYMPVNMAFDQALSLHAGVLAGTSDPVGYCASDADPQAFLEGIEYLARWDRAYHLLQGNLEETIERYAQTPCLEMLWFLHNMARHDALPEPSRDFNGRVGKGHAKDTAAANWWEHCDLFWEAFTRPMPGEEDEAP